MGASHFLSNTLEGYRYTNQACLRRLRIFQPAKAGLVRIAPGFSLWAFEKSGMLPNPIDFGLKILAKLLREQNAIIYP